MTDAQGSRLERFKSKKGETVRSILKLEVVVEIDLRLTGELRLIAKREYMWEAHEVT